MACSSDKRRLLKHRRLAIDCSWVPGIRERWQLAGLSSWDRLVAGVVGIEATILVSLMVVLENGSDVPMVFCLLVMRKRLCWR